MRLRLRLRPLALIASTVGLAVLLAVPVEAAKRKQRAAAKPHLQAVDAYPVRSTSVYDQAGKYLGADPDPRIRHELLRDLGAHYGGNF
jgi:hypothetical protein